MLDLQDVGEKEASLRGLEASMRLQQSDVEQKLQDMAEQRDRLAHDRKVGYVCVCDLVVMNTGCEGTIEVLGANH